MLVAVAGKFLKTFMLICFQKSSFLSFCIKIGFPSFSLKCPPFGFPYPKFFSATPSFWHFQNLVPPFCGGHMYDVLIFKKGFMCLEDVLDVAYCNDLKWSYQIIPRIYSYMGSLSLCLSVVKDFFEDLWVFLFFSNDQNKRDIACMLSPF